MLCPNCSHPNSEEAKFCIRCGTRLEAGAGEQPQPGRQASSSGEVIKNVKETAGNIASMVNTKVREVTGDDGKSSLKLSDLFTNVPKKHTNEERDEIFICGTATTTPPETNMTAGWQKPWLYSRLFIFFVVAFIILYIAATLLNNIIVYPGMMIMGSFAVPFAVCFLFFELHVPRNMSFFSVMKIFIIGGCLSILAALILFSIIGFSGSLNYGGAFLVGLIEEIGKFVIVAFVLSKGKKHKFILTGLLIGAAVGAGFAAFESAGYSFTSILNAGFAHGVRNIIVRGILSPGGHVAWAAIEGGALMLAAQGNGFSWSLFKKPNFIILLAVPVVLHFLWDCPLLSDVINGYLKYAILIVIAWIFLLHLIKSGLSQIDRFQREGEL